MGRETLSWVETKGGTVEADIVILNLTMEMRLLMEILPFKPLQASPPRDGWGAFMVYAGVDTSAVKHLEGLHHQFVNDQPLGNGKPVFFSISPEWDKPVLQKIGEQLL